MPISVRFILVIRAQERPEQIWVSQVGIFKFICRLFIIGAFFGTGSFYSGHYCRRYMDSILFFIGLRFVSEYIFSRGLFFFLGFRLKAINKDKILCIPMGAFSFYCRSLSSGRISFFRELNILSGQLF